MRKGFSVQQAQAIDRFAIEQLGIPSLVLMENAGRLTAAEIIKALKTKRKNLIIIFCGSGNNGGDGFVIARHLWASGISVKVFLIGTPQDLKSDPAINYQILKKLKCSVRCIRKVDKKVLAELKRATLIVDAIFGIGLSRSVGEPYKSIMDAINQTKKSVVAVDVPSGMDATTGKALGTCVKASLTVTFAVMKKGFLTAPSHRYAGKVIVADIGIPLQAIQRFS
ncbi:MAG: NAD(P)H-hydrate epimerase [Candidatus Omnitrophica bacterium]|nr:NAD(P)H-hydrate epimerase [Candidatus Omnitrophota bacterium]